MDWYTSLEFQAVLNSIVRSKVFVMIFKFTIAIVAIVSSMVCQLQKQTVEKIHRGLKQAQAWTVVWWPLMSDK